MKKMLLSISVALLATPAFARVDGNYYPPVNEIDCKSEWMLSRFLDLQHEVKEYSNLKIANPMARTACMYNGIVYVGDSGDTETQGEGVVNLGSIYRFSAVDGSEIGKLELTLDGKRLAGVRPANQVGIDNFGNLWVIGMTQRSAEAPDAKVKVYSVDKETGACTLQGLLDFLAPNTRMDYFDIVGDVTRTEAKCIVMAPAATPATDLCVFRWIAEQGSSDWEGGFDGDTELVMSGAYPTTAIQWSYAPTVTIVLGEDEAKYNGDLFYVDGYTTFPCMYNTTGSMDDSFENAPDLAPASVGTNGVTELQLAGKNFIAYSLGQYDGANKCQINICELGAGMMFTGMTKYWTLPANGLGQTSDSGNRVHSICREYFKENGEVVGARLLTFKSMNGMGVYIIGRFDSIEGSLADNDATITVNGNVITVSAEASEIAIFNIAGQEVAKVKNATEISAPSAGAYIVKAMVDGAPIVKKIVL